MKKYVEYASVCNSVGKDAISKANAIKELLEIEDEPNT